MNRRELVQLAVLMLLGQSLSGCGDAPPALHYDRDTCEYCRMTLTDRRYGAAVKLPGGRTHIFDTLDCLAAWLAEEPSRQPTLMWTVAATSPGVLTGFDTVKFLLLAEGSGPMGKGHLAVSPETAPEDWGGVTVSWADIQQAVLKRP